VVADYYMWVIVRWLCSDCAVTVRWLCGDCAVTVERLMNRVCSCGRSLLYVQIHWMFPECSLSLVAAAHGETVPYMDLLIRQNRRRGLITSIYDKRLEAKCANINVIRYPDTQSVMATKAKYGIVTSQLYRFLRRCTLATDFVYNISLVLHRLLNKGYHRALVPWIRTSIRLYRHFFSFFWVASAWVDIS
jgi:hypothetical protein